VLIQSFSAASLRLMHELEPRLPLIQLIGDRTSELLGRLGEVREYAAGIGPAGGLVDEGVVAAAHAAGLAVHPWTLVSPDDHERFVALGVDGGFTNFPDRFAAALGRA
jgi:glycerophosphoryl diester phosphodiesterase